MKCKILTEERWQRLLEDKLTREESDEIYRHLDTDCPDCEQFIAQMTSGTEKKLRNIRDDLLNPDCMKSVESDVAVMDIAHQTSWPKGVPCLKRDLAPVSAFTRTTIAWMGGIAALFIVTVGIMPQLYFGQGILKGSAPIPFQKEKGVTAPLSTMALDFSTGHRLIDGQLVVERGVEGGVYPPDELLFLQYEISSRGYVYIIGYQDSKQAELLYPLNTRSLEPTPAGEHKANDSNNRVVGYTLNDVQGLYMVVGIYSPRPLDVQSEVIPAVRNSANLFTGTIDQKGLRSIGEGIAFDSIHFDVGN